MATQSVEFSAPSGQTVTARLFSAGNDTIVQTASAVTEATNRDGVYTATFTDAAAGAYRLIATNSGGILLAQWWVDLTLTTATFQAYEMPVSVIQSGLSTFSAASDSVTVGSMNANTVTASALATDAVTEIQSGLSTLDAAGVRAAVGLVSANLDTQIADLPTVAEFEARTLLAAAYFDPATDTVANVTTVGSVSGSVGSISGVSFPANFGSLLINVSGHVSRVTLVDTTTTNTDMRGTNNAALATAWTATRAGYLDGVLLADNYNQRIVAVTGSKHVAADVHEFQPEVITSAATAASFVSEMQSGLATSEALATVDGIVDKLLQRTGFSLAVLAGAVSNPQSSSSTYSITVDNVTYTVGITGQDETGVRTGQTLSES